MPQPQLLENVITVLNNNTIDYMVTGSIVSSLQGEPRATHDVDIVVNIQLSSITDLINTFSPPRFYLSEESIREANELPRGKPTGYLRTTSTDCYISSDTPFLFLDFQYTF